MAIIRKSALLAFTAAAVAGAFALPSLAGDFTQSKALHPLQAGRFDVGSKKALAYYQAEQKACKVTVILSEPLTDALTGANSAPGNPVRFNTVVASGTSTRVETAEGASVALWCSPQAATLFVQPVDRVAYVAPAR